MPGHGVCQRVQPGEVNAASPPHHTPPRQASRGGGLTQPTPSSIASPLQPCGYYALMDYARSEGTEGVLVFVENAARYRLASRDDTRTQR